MIEEDTVAGKHAVSLSVFLHHPEAILLCNRIWAEWVERCVFVLRNFLNLSVQLRSRSLVNTAGLIHAKHMYCLKDTKNAKRVHVSCIFCCIKRHAYMALCCQIVDLCRADFISERSPSCKVMAFSAIR